jgi:hypothetical protein
LEGLHRRARLGACPMLTSLIAYKVREEVSQAKRFSELAGRCLGAWPADIVESLTELSLDRGELSDQAHALLNDAKQSVQFASRSDPCLPLEHPIDSDWRFAREEQRRLLDNLISSIPAQEKILIVCAPTIVLEAGRRGIGSRVVVGIRRNDPVAEALQRTVPEAKYLYLDSLCGVEAAAGMVDPPWHDEVAEPLVQRLVCGVRIGGRILISGPDKLTAASSVHKLRSVVGSPSWTGLAPEGAPIRVRYQTPRFEARALQAGGIGNVPSDWRTGLVHLYFKTAGVRQSDDLVSGSDWKERTIDGHRFWIRPRMASSEAILSTSSSVSRTAPLRKAASIWTSGNTVVTGGSQRDLELLAAGSVRKASAEFITRLLEWEEGSCWKPCVPTDRLLAAHSAQCENTGASLHW